MKRNKKGAQNKKTKKGNSRRLIEEETENRNIINYLNKILSGMKRNMKGKAWNRKRLIEEETQNRSLINSLSETPHDRVINHAHSYGRSGLLSVKQLRTHARTQSRMY